MTETFEIDSAEAKEAVKQLSLEPKAENRGKNGGLNGTIL